MRLNKKILIGLILIMSVSIVGCKKDKVDVKPDDLDNEKVEVVNTVESNNTIQGLKEEFIGKGFKIQDNDEIPHKVFDSDDSAILEINGETIEIYKYDLDNLSSEAEEMIAHSREKFANFIVNETPAYYRNGLLIVINDSSKQKEEILEVFNNY